MNTKKSSRLVPLGLALLLLGASCSSGSATKSADDVDPQKRESGSTIEGENPGDSGVVAQRYSPPFVQPIRLPDLSVLSETGRLVEDSLGPLAGESEGLDVIAATCEAAGGELNYQGSEDSEDVFEVAADGSGTYKDKPTPTSGVEITINADGSGTYENKSSPVDGIEITVEADGSGTYSDSSSSEGQEVTFTTEKGILDPKILTISPLPTFAVADRFPPLGKLGSITPPCATIIRLYSNILFDFDSDELRPEATPVIEGVAATLIDTGKDIEVHGHTDSKGEDDYNLDLSERRAEAFSKALVEQGVTSTIKTQGLGETKPAAPNEKPDGSDDPAGRQQNRRIEILVRE